MFSFSTAVKPSTALFSASSKKEKKTNAKRIVSMATVDGEKKSAKEMPDENVLEEDMFVDNPMMK